MWIVCIDKYIDSSQHNSSFIATELHVS